MRNAKLLAVNTLVLTVGSFIMRTVAVAFNVYLTNQIGAAGIGLVQLVMAVYGLLVTFAGAGAKLGATRIVTDELSLGKNPESIMKTCIKYALSVGCCVSAVLFLSAGLIGEKWINDAASVTSLKILALSLPPISVSGALNGYFTARKTMLKYSSVQLTEQTVKIIITVLALKICGTNSTENAATAVSVGILASEIFSMLCSYILYKSDTKHKEKNINSRNNLKSLLRIAVPDVIGSGFRGLLLTVEHLLIPKGFEKAGNSTENSMSIYGIIHGMAFPLLLYPSAVLTSLSAMLIPELSRYKLLGNTQKITFAVSSSLKLTLIFSFGVSAFMFVFTDLITNAVYDNNEAVFYIKLLSLLVPVMYTDIVTDGLLKGLDQQNASMRYNIFDSGMCVILVIILLPRLAIKGYVFILFLSEIINFVLSMNKLAKTATVKINLANDIIKPVFCSLLSCGIIKIWLHRSFYYGKFSLALTVIVFSALYIFLICLLQSIRKDEIFTYRSLFKKVALD